MIVERVSPLTGKLNKMDLPITAEQIERFNNGASIQQAFPNLNGDQREFIQTGYTLEDWKAIFGDEED